MVVVLRHISLIAIAMATALCFADEADLLSQAKDQMHAGQLKEASITIQQFLRHNPRSSPGWELSARIHLRQKETMLAIVEYTKAIGKDPNARAELFVARAKAWTQLPNEREKRKNLDKAIRSLDEGIKRLGPVFELTSFRGELESRQNEVKISDHSTDNLEIKAVRSTGF
jgi:predicted Zn-dependent protease